MVFYFHVLSARVSVGISTLPSVQCTVFIGKVDLTVGATHVFRRHFHLTVGACFRRYFHLPSSCVAACTSTLPWVQYVFFVCTFTFRRYLYSWRRPPTGGTCFLWYFHRAVCIIHDFRVRFHLPPVHIFVGTPILPSLLRYFPSVLPSHHRFVFFVGNGCLAWTV